MFETGKSYHVKNSHKENQFDCIVADVVNAFGYFKGDPCVKFQTHFHFWEEIKEPQSGELWVHVYPNGSYCFDERKMIITGGSNGKPIARIKVQWKEGQFDE